MISGLTDKHTEFFLYKDSHFSASNGSVVKQQTLPLTFTRLLWNAIVQDVDVQKGLSLLNIKTKEEQIQQFYACNYSEADDSPDLTRCGKLGKREFIRCAKRCGNCPAENLLCKIPYGITLRELQVLKQIGIGKLDKEICETLQIAKDTLRTHKDSISKKTNTSRKAQLSIVAHQLKLV